MTVTVNYNKLPKEKEVYEHIERLIRGLLDYKESVDFTALCRQELAQSIAMLDRVRKHNAEVAAVRREEKLKEKREKHLRAKA